MKKIILTITLLVMTIIIVGCGTKNKEGKIEVKLLGDFHTNGLYFDESYTFDGQEERDEYFERREFIIKNVDELNNYVGFPKNSTPFASGGWYIGPYGIALTDKLGFNLFRKEIKGDVLKLTDEFDANFFKKNNLLILQGGYEYHLSTRTEIFIEGDTIYTEYYEIFEYDLEFFGYENLILKRRIMIIPKNSKVNKVVFIPSSEFENKK